MDFYKSKKGLLEANEKDFRTTHEIEWFVFIYSDVQSNGKCICFKGGVNG